MVTNEELKAANAKSAKDHEEITAKLTTAINKKDEQLKNDNKTGELENLADNGDDSFKTRLKRKTGSIQNAQLPVYEYPSCKKVNVDLVMCSRCSRFVCEECNNIPVGKLKNLVKMCKTIYFICSDCSFNKPMVSNNLVHPL